MVVRGANGTVIWDNVPAGPHAFNWVCQRDSFAIAAPTDATEANAFLVTLNQHSASLIGTVSQVVQLSL